MASLGSTLADLLQGVLTPDELAAALETSEADEARNLWWEDHRPTPTLDGRPLPPPRRDPADVRRLRAHPAYGRGYGPVADARFDGTERAQHGIGYRCLICRDAGFVRRDVEVTHPDFGRALPCRCQVENDATRASRHALRVKRSGLPAPLAACTLDTFQRLPGTTVALEAAHALLDAYRTQADAPRWVAFFGQPGRGKSHLLAALAQALATLTDVAWATVPDLLADCKAHRPDPATGELRDFALDTMLTERAMTVPVLVLDRVGGQSEGAWGTEKLERILNRRYEERLVTALGMELSATELAQWSARIASRVSDRSLCVAAALTCGDYRQRAPKGETA